MKPNPLVCMCLGSKHNVCFSSDVAYIFMIQCVSLKRYSLRSYTCFVLISSVLCSVDWKVVFVLLFDAHLYLFKY